MKIKIFYRIVVVISLTAIHGLAIFVNAQSTTPGGVPNNLKINSTKPSVFLTFENYGEIQAAKSGPSAKVVFLRFHNNSTRPIAVYANFDMRLVRTQSLTLADGTGVDTVSDGSRMDVCFDVDVNPTWENTMHVTQAGTVKLDISPLPSASRKKENPAQNDSRTCYLRDEWRADNFGNGERIWIKPGNSFIFDVPANYFGDSLKVSTPFYYEWEFSQGRLDFDEPKHKVFFFGSALSK